MKHVTRLFAAVVLATLVSAGFAQLPTPDQIGAYSGTGSLVMNVDLESSKLVKQPASFLVIVNADGTMQMQVVFEGGAPGMGAGDGIFGSAGAVYRIGIEALVATGRLTFKGTGTKVKASGTLNLITPSFYTFGEGTLKLKKLVL